MAYAQYELKDHGAAFFMIADRRLLKRFDTADGIGRLFHRPVDIPDTFSLHGLDIAVHDQTAHCPADSVAGAVIRLYQLIFGREQLLIGIFFLFYFLF